MTNDMTSGNDLLWYKQPADQWQDGLPLANGRMGAMIFGGARAERLALSETTFCAAEEDIVVAFWAWVEFEGDRHVFLEFLVCFDVAISARGDGHDGAFDDFEFAFVRFGFADQIFARFAFLFRVNTPAVEIFAIE